MIYRLDGSSADSFESKVKVLEANKVNGVLDDIESNVYDALKLIEQIEGIEDIDKCKTILKEMHVKL